MHGQERRRSQHRLRIPLVALHLIVNPEFLEQPQYPLRPRIVEVVHDDHAGIVWHSSAANTAGEPLADQPGNSAWQFSLAIQPGNSAWQFSLAIQPFSPGGN